MLRRWTVVFLCLFLLLPAAGLGEETQIVVTFLGDCTIGGEDRVRDMDISFDSYLARHGYAYFFEKVQPVIGRDDLTVANLEGVFLDYSVTKQPKTYNFRGPRDFVNVLTASSVEAVNVANNHTFDFGTAGIKSTVKTLTEAGVAWFGTMDDVAQTYIFEKDGVRIGFAGMNLTYWNRRRGQIENQIKQLRADGCQAVVGCMHGGTEYAIHRDDYQKNCAYALIDYGCDVVIGHHPHVLQGVEVKDGATICYSLGNFVFGGNAKIRAPYTALFQFAFSFDGEGTYLGHRMNIIPALPSGERDYNNYQPVLAAGQDAEAALALIQQDTPFALNPFAEGVGALQDFVPANR